MMIDDARSNPLHVLNQPGWVGAVSSVALPLALAAIWYALMLAAGVTTGNPAFGELPFDPSGAISAAIWISLFGLYGITRWLAVRNGREGERTSLLVVAMMIWTLIYTAMAGQLSRLGLDAANVFSLALGIFTASRLARLSRRLVSFLIPSFLWKVLAVGVGLAPVLGIRLF
jgi:tryptophan-rich sensory protein